MAGVTKKATFLFFSQEKSHLTEEDMTILHCIGIKVEDDNNPAS